jgi:uncharacterized protein (DUF433 family)
MSHPVKGRTRVTKTPGVCGGRACIANTRLTIWGLERARQLGRSDAQLLEDYPHLTLDDLAAAWEYVAQHRDEIEEDIRENEEP